MDIRDEVGRFALRRALLGMGLAKSQASNFASGMATPGLAMAARIEAEIGLPAMCWVSGNRRAEMFRLIVDAEIARRAETQGATA